MRKTVSLADRKGVLEALKQLYAKEVKDDQCSDVTGDREPGTTRSGEMDQNSKDV